MKIPKLTLERANQLFQYDSLTGVITRKIAISNSVKVGAVAGFLKSNGYLRVRVDGVLLYAHRLAWLLHYGKSPDDCADYKNRIRSANWIANLRDVPYPSQRLREGNKAHIRLAGHPVGKTQC